MKKLIMLLALVGAFSLVSISSAQFTSSQTWGSFGNGTGQFYGLSGVATDTSGNIYVAELDNRVQKFSGNGAYITQFNIPARNIAIDSSGNIYATVNDSIKKFNSAGTLLNTWGSTGAGNGAFNFPIGIALDSSGNIYVSDTENNRIQKLDSSGNYVTSWGTSGSGNGNLKSPAGIAVSGNYVYVADMGNYRIQKFDLNGNYVSSIGIQGTGNTQFNSSIAVANDPSGNIYVADYYNGRVIEYDSNFNYLTQYTGFSYPTALVIANSNLYVLDSGNYQVYKYYNDNNIHANFTSNVTSGYAPLTVQFNDSSENATSVSWDFENDGISDSAERNPIHRFTTPGNYTVNLTAINVNGTDSKLATITVSGQNEGELQLWTFDASKVSAVPNNIYTASRSSSYISNVSLTYNSTLGSIDSRCWHDDDGDTYFTGAYPTVNENLTFTMGVDSNSEWSYGYMHTSVAYVGVRHVSDGSYEIESYWTSDSGSQLSSSFQIPKASVINNRVTVSIHSYDSNRTNVITAGPALSVTTPYTTETTRKLPYTNVIQPLIYIECYASGTDGWVNVHLYNIKQSIPRNIITPYARNDIMAFGLDYPNVTNNKQGTDFLISRGQSASVYVSGANLGNSADIAYDNSLFANGFKECVHFYPGLASESLEGAKETIDSQIALIKTAYGLTPASWSSHENQDNVTHAIYAYNKYGALYRNGPMGMGFVPNVDTLSTATWTWWSVSSARGAISPCFTHQTDISPAIPYSIDPTLFRTFVTNLNSKGINLVDFSKWYYSSMAQTATTNILQSDANNIKFQLNTSGGYPVNMNIKTVSSPLHLDCNGVLIPFNQTADGVQFMSVGNGTYTLTNTPGPVLPVANFTSNTTGGYAPLTVQFNDSSKNATSVSWDFNGDGVSDSAERTPIHRFTTSGNYIVNLTATNVNGTNSTSGTINVSEKPILPVANFTSNTTGGFAPLTVQFNDSSKNATSVSWDFNGDGVSDSAERTPIHRFTTSGNYIVNLTATNVNGTNSTSGTINVSEKPILPVANFTSNTTGGYAPLTVQFNDSSENATSVSWDFNGDGISDSAERTPIHRFNTSGIYTVNLTAINVNGTNSTSATINVSENLVFPGYTNPPTDPDHDGLYEDINGNGILDFGDVVGYYDNMNWIQNNANVAFFDYNNNNLIDFSDVVILYDMI